jgi:hypothetical protein
MGIMLTMIIYPIPAIDKFWRQEEDGVMPEHQFGAILHMLENRFKFIRQHVMLHGICSAIPA